MVFRTESTNIYYNPVDQYHLREVRLKKTADKL